MGTVRISSQQSSPATTFFLEADVVETQASFGTNGRRRIRFFLRAINGPGGTTGSQFNGAGTQIGRWNGNEFGRRSANPFLPSGFANNATRWNLSFDVWVNGNTNGFWSGSSTSMPLQMALNYGSVSTTPTGSVPVPRIPRAPGAPGAPTFSQITPLGVRLAWTAAARGNAAITQYQWQVATTNGFGNVVASGNSGTTLNATASGLNPGTTYFARVRAVNGDGTGAWSAVRSFTTLPSAPPTLSVAPSLDGRTAVVTLAPPAGATGVTRYTIERRLTGTTAPVTSFDSTTATATASGLTPGNSYEWRASAWFGTYQSPFSDWVTVVQPNPNTSPGSYFDGATGDTQDTDFAWTGTPNNSISTASGRRATGWMPFAESAAVSGGTGAQQRITGAIGLYPDGSLTGEFAARYTFFTDAASAGFVAGTSVDPLQAAEVSEGGTYFGQVTASVSRDQVVAGVIIWLDPAGVEVGRSVGEPVLAEAGEPVLVVVSGLAAQEGYAAVGVVDVDDGSGLWSLYEGGDEIVVDAAALFVGAQYPYFDGDAADTAQFLYEWLGEPNASVSTRTTLALEEPDPLADPDCPAPPSPPSPPAIEDDCIVEVGVWRRYWVQVPANEVTLWLAVIPTLRLTTGDVAAQQVRIRYYSNPTDEAPSGFDSGEWEAEQIIRFIPPHTVMTVDGVSERVRASVAGRPSLPADHLLSGTGGGPATWPLLRCGEGYLISLDVPLDAPSGNLAADLSLTRRML